jgi:cytochrome P450
VIFAGLIRGARPPHVPARSRTTIEFGPTQLVSPRRRGTLGPVTDVDVFDPRTFGRGVPHEALRLLRDTDPVSWQEEPEIGIWPAGPGFWAVTRYDDVKQVLRTPEVFSSALGATQIRDPDPADLPFVRRMILNMDPPEQLRLRRLVTGAFTRRRLERFADARCSWSGPTA